MYQNHIIALQNMQFYLLRNISFFANEFKAHSHFCHLPVLTISLSLQHAIFYNRVVWYQ